ncbi:hypothetical protein [Nostoc sp.]|uniref:hypothetical protein n=1 Tax=Nostoc sp. TaxID=1180 RepID=UPI002FF6FFA5
MAHSEAITIIENLMDNFALTLVNEDESITGLTFTSHLATNAKPPSYKKRYGVTKTIMGLRRLIGYDGL